jgi:hypothetical protein
VLEGLVDQETAAGSASNRHDFEIEMNQALRRRKAEEKEAAAAQALEPEEAAVEEEEEQEVGLRLAPSDK